MSQTEPRYLLILLLPISTPVLLPRTRPSSSSTSGRTHAARRVIRVGCSSQGLLVEVGLLLKPAAALLLVGESAAAPTTATTIVRSLVVVALVSSSLRVLMVPSYIGIALVIPRATAVPSHVRITVEVIPVAAVRPPIRVRIPIAIAPPALSAIVASIPSGFVVIPPVLMKI